MLYIANFSYSDDNERDDNYVLMPCVVDADNADEALDRFTEMLERLHATEDLLAGATEVYLDSLVEIPEVPKDAILVQWQKIVPGDEGLVSLATALPVPSDSDAVAYGFDYEDESIGGEDEDEDEDEEDYEDDLEDEDEEETFQEPFLTFE
jgi:hypothetical protein